MALLGAGYTQFVGFTCIQCNLEYGVSPCQARLSKENGGPEAVSLHATAYARRVGGLTGAADSKLVSGSLWFKFDSDITTNQTIFAGETALAGGTTRFSIFIQFGNLIIQGNNSGGTGILQVQAISMELGRWHHLLFSFDLSSTSKRWVYLDGVSTGSYATYTNDTMDFTLADWSIGGVANGSSLMEANSQFAEVWIAPGVYIDFSIAANRDKFRSESMVTLGFDGRPRDLGSNGATPTGSQPLVYFKSAASSWFTNSGSGGGFTQTGSGATDVDFATGEVKCYNSVGTCQDLANFDPTFNVLGFSEDVPVPQEVQNSEAGGLLFPFIKEIDYQSPIISLGDDMGQRASITVKMRDGPHNDTPSSIFDKYLDEREFFNGPFDISNPLGTFWTKFRARNPYMRFQFFFMYLVQANLIGELIDETQEVYSFALESFSGPDSDGTLTITAKDYLKILDGDFAQAPQQSAGFLSSSLTAIATTATINPSGSLGDYPSSGYACIGGNEIVAYTQTGGDNVSLTRGQLGTTAATHDAQDRFQLVLRYASQSPDLIIADLLTTYGGFDPGTIDSVAWATEISSFLGTVYTLIVTEPTPVKDLVSEIIQQIGGAIWWDPLNSLVKLQILRGIATDSARFNEDNVVEQSLRIQDQEEKRVTEVSVYFGQINPTLKRDETRNYASVATIADELTQALVGSKSIKTLFARGIPSGGRAVAEKLAHKYLSRYVIPPRRFNFDIMKYSGVQPPELGGGYLLGGGEVNQRSWPLFDENGEAVEVPIQVTRINPVGAKFQVEAEEMLFTAFADDFDPTMHIIIFDTSLFNVNLRTVHDSIYAEAISGDTVEVIINGGVIIGSTSTAAPAFEVGLFAAGVTVNITVNGRIQGKGGEGGGRNRPAPYNGEAGGTALYTRQAINLDNNSEIWGGGGGGGISNGPVGDANFNNTGGGGAGTLPGIGGVTIPNVTFQNPGNPGTSEAGGDQPFSPAGGDGGGPGLAGQNATGGLFFNSNGGAAGTAVDGNSFITYSSTGDRRGGLIN